jgi:hypothetical protein
LYNWDAPNSLNGQFFIIPKIMAKFREYPSLYSPEPAQPALAERRIASGSLVETQFIPSGSGFYEFTRPQVAPVVRLICHLALAKLVRTSLRPGVSVAARKPHSHLRIYVPGWENTPLRQMRSAEFGVPVSVDSDANVAALGEHRFGAGNPTVGLKPNYKRGTPLARSR